ncbi:unnamed protein product [Chrysoparadoxa australica]
MKLTFCLLGALAVSSCSAFHVAPTGPIMALRQTSKVFPHPMQKSAMLPVALTSFAASVASVPAALAEYVDLDEVSVPSEDLPPIWLPIAVAVGLLVLTGLQQLSLGDVMEEEARLGEVSGARAARQSARNRSLFKNKKD